MNQQNSVSSKTALITGATVGIGYELAKLFAGDNYNLVLIARNEKILNERKHELEKAFDINVTVIPKDLGNPGAADDIYKQLAAENIAIDTLINNAGFGLLGDFSALDYQQQMDMINLNITALTALCKLFLKDMIQRDQGNIMNVASTAAFQPGPSMAVYYASKAYVLHFTEALAYELKNTHIHVNVLCPGPTDTEFHKRAGVKNTLLMKGQVMSAAAVAKVGYQGLKRGKTIIIPGFMNKLLAYSVRFTPRKIIVAIVGWLQQNRM